MVYCIKLKDGKCSYTGGKCIINNPKTIEDYKLCPQRELAKDYNEMNMTEKAFDNSIRNKSKLSDIEERLSVVEDNIKYIYRVVYTDKKKQKKLKKRVPKLPNKPPIETVELNKDWGFFKWLRKRK